MAQRSNILNKEDNALAQFETLALLHVLQIKFLNEIVC